MVTDIVCVGFPVHTLRTGAVVLDLLLEVELEGVREPSLDGTASVPYQQTEHWTIHRQLSPGVPTVINNIWLNLLSIHVYTSISSIFVFYELIMKLLLVQHKYKDVMIM